MTRKAAAVVELVTAEKSEKPAVNVITAVRKHSEWANKEARRGGRLIESTNAE